MANAQFNAGPSPARRWTVSQIGAREHYAVPRALEGSGRLRTLYTDVWLGGVPGTGARALAGLSPKVRSLAGRFHPEVPGEKVVSFTLATLLEQRRAARSRAAGGEAVFREYVRAGEAFARRVTQHLAKHPLHPQRDAFFGFFTGTPITSSS